MEVRKLALPLRAYSLTNVLAGQGSWNTKTLRCKQTTVFATRYEFLRTKPPKSEVVDDATDPGGTLRPNPQPEPTFGTHFDPLPCPEFEFRIALPASVDRHSLIDIFDLF